jgi:hypothetical protein
MSLKEDTMFAGVGGRKFVLTVVFLVFVALNYGFKFGIDWEGLAIMGASIGVYDISNAIKG